MDPGLTLITGLIFLVAIFGGGWLYGELWVVIGDARRPGQIYDAVKDGFDAAIQI